MNTCSTFNFESDTAKLFDNFSRGEHRNSKECCNIIAYIITQTYFIDFREVNDDEIVSESILEMKC